MSASMIKKPEYNGVGYSWIWMDREFIEWFAGVMSGTVDPYDTPAIRAITAKDHEQAFTKYIEDVSKYLMDVAKCRNDREMATAIKLSQALPDQLCEAVIAGSYDEYEIMG